MLRLTNLLSQGRIFATLAILFLLVFSAPNLNGQAFICDDAVLLCSLDELDGFMATMPTNAENPFDGLPENPAPFCGGAGSNGSGNPQNMSWFAFIAGGPTATLELVFSNCSGGLNGVQFGIYTDCTFSDFLPGACFGNAVSANDTHILNLSGMTAGDDYFFFIDGDNGTVCDYEINVLSGGGPVPVPQPTEILCTSSNCPMDGNVCSTGETFTFEPAGLDLTIDYIWTVNPNPPSGQTIVGDNSISLTFNNTGTYDICMTATNGCTTTDEVCYTLNVLEADAGMLVADPEELCPGETSSVTASGYVDSSPIEQGMIAVGPDGVVIAVNTGDMIDVTYESCGIVTVYSYNFNPADSPPLPMVGDTYSEPGCNNSCCDTESIEVNFNDTEPPTLLDTPANITIECSDPVPDIVEVAWTDNCDGAGVVAGMQMDDYNACDGGTITRTWSYTDGCMNTIDYEQVITVNSQMGGSFDQEPMDMTFDCVADIPDPIDLNWMGDCDGTAVVSPVDGGDTDLCAGGIVTRTWTHNDACGGFTEYVQSFTINPANAGEFVDPPGNTDAQCDQSDLAAMQDLIWMGDCEGTATVSGVEVVDVNSCFGGTITRTWSYTDGCGAFTEHIQIITVNSPPLADPIDPPPPVLNINCDEIPSSFPTLTFTNGQTGDCSIMGDAVPEVMGDATVCGGSMSVVWVYTDACFNVSSYIQNINILPAAEPDFIDPPADMTISCVESFPVPDPLDYSNNQTGGCEISGTVMPLTTTEGDICGGDIMNIWEFTDECGVLHSHQQTIIIDPIPEPMYIDPPADITIQCNETPPAAPDLAYTNNESDACEIMGTVTPVTTGTSDECGGELTYTWEFIDNCDRTITHTQVITIEPAPEAEFILPPVDISIGCDEIPPSPPMLSYSNNEVVGCLISGDVAPSVDDQSNSCGGMITYTWEFIDACSRPIMHQQVITIIEAPMATYDNPPTNETVSCANIPADAGPLSYNNGDPCEIMGTVSPVIDNNYDICGGTITNTWEFTDECDRSLSHVQIITIEPAPTAEFQNLPENTTVACGDDATSPGNLMYTNNESGGCTISGVVSPTQSGEYTACGGDILFTWEFVDECDRIIQHVQTVVVEPAAPAEFIDPPDPITVSCADFNTTPPMLSYTNGDSDICEISGSVPGVVIGSPSPCGVDVTYRWEFVDECGRTITHNQLVTIEAAAEATFTSPPGSITVNCDMVDVSPPSLSYDNGASGICAITGSVNGIQSGVFDECGGDITYSWTFTDACNRTITHSQDVTVTPASDPVFIDPPVDLTLDCGEDFPDNPTLDYTNSETGACAIAGSVLATSSVVGNITTYTWEFTNDCNGTSIIHNQDITGVPTPDISIDPINTILCLGESFDLSTINVMDVNGNSLTITYTDATGVPVVDPNVSPTGTSTYTVIAANDAGCTDEAIFTINVDEPPFAGNDGSGIACSDGGLTFNLFDYLTGSFTPGGTWFDTDGSGANIDDPINASFSNVIPGIYTFTYTVFSSNSCPDAEASIELEIIGELDFEITTVECAPGGATYNVNVITNGNNIFANPGDVVVIDGNNVIVENIPAGQLVVISAIDPNAFCISDQTVNAPDCDCPDIPSPVSNGDAEICDGDDIPELTVTVESGLTANWYDSQSGTTALIENSLSYTPTVSGPGTYNFYVEAEDSDGCVSLVRTLVTLTILNNPDAADISVSVCQDEDGNGIVDLQSLNLDINNNANFNFNYYETLSDAENELNALDATYTTMVNVSIFVVVTNSSGCKSIAEISIAINLPPSFSIMVNNEVCLDSMDGSIVISGVNPIGTTFSINNVDFMDVTSFTELEVGSYTLYAQSPDGCESSDNFEISEGLELTYTDLVLDCNDNDTNTDSTDDFYDVSLTLSNNIGASGNVNVSTESMDLGDYSYGSISFVIPSGISQTITITDLDTGCSIEIVTGDLSPCSTSCVVSLDPIDIVCDGNGTDSDPNDDVYIITINASSVNGAGNNSFNVTVDGLIVDNFQYGTGGTITIPAQGQTVIIGAVDNADDQCFATQSIGPLNPCSDACVISIDNQNFSCNSNGTIGVPSDDFYTFAFTILSTNGGANFRLLIDGVEVGVFDYATLGEYEIPADDMTHTIQFIDSDNAACLAEIISPVLSSCSGNCTINGVVQMIDCNNELTADDELDDTFTADIFINIVGGTSMWSIPATGQTGNSGETVTVGPFLITDGVVILEIVDSNIGDCSTTIELTPPTPCSSCNESVEAGNDWELDCTIVEAELEGVPSQVIDGTWSGPGGFMFGGNAVTVDVPGTYYFSADFGDGCIRTDSLIVSVSNEIPAANGGENQELTCILDTVYLTGTVTGGSGNFTYQWLDGDMIEISTDLTIEVTEPGNYFFVVYDVDSDCTSPPSLVEVTENTADLMPNIYADPENAFNCVVEEIILSTDMIPNVEYKWFVNNVLIQGNTLSITIVDEANVMLEAVDTVTGCTGMNSLFIENLEEYPIVNLQDADILDCVNGMITLDGSGSQNGDNITYTWIDEENNIIGTDIDMLDVSEGGTYYLQLIDVDNNCTNTDTVEVTSNIDLPVVMLDESATINCDAAELAVSLISEIDPNDLDINWQTADGIITSATDLDEVTVGSEGTYVVSVINPTNQCETIDTIIINLPEQIEDSNISIADESCEESNNGEITIDQIIGGTEPYTYYIGGVEIDSDHLGDLDSGTYDIEVIDDNGCNYETQVTVSVQEEFEVDLIPTITLTQGQSSVLVASVNLPSSEIASVLWSPAEGLSCTDCLSPTVTASNGNITYTVGITDIFGCYAEAQIELRSNEDIIITIPNIFKPNNQGTGNANFTIYSSIDAIVSKMRIYDRWGNLVYANDLFATNAPLLGWNGRFNDKEVVPGVYVYLAEILIDGNIEERSGDITVIK